MATVREEKLHVVLEKDRHQVVLNIPADLPFTADSIQQTLRALREYSYGPPDFSWSRMFGLRFVLSLNEEDSTDFDFEAFADTDFPLRVEQPATSELLIRVSFIDVIESQNDTVAVLLTNQVCTAYQLNRLVDSWIESSDLLQGTWLLDLRNNNLVVFSKYVSRPAIMRATQPTYTATVEPVVYVHCDDNGRTGQATVALRYRVKSPTFEADLSAASELSGFSDLSERRRVIRATYTGPETRQVDPELLVSDLRKVALKLMRTLSVHEPLHGSLTVVLDKSRCSVKSGKSDLELTQHFPISSS